MLNDTVHEENVPKKKTMSMETIRTAQREDAADIARVHIDCWRTTYKGIFPDALLAGLSYKGREQY
jgi:hypothetical protein